MKPALTSTNITYIKARGDGKQKPGNGKRETSIFKTKIAKRAGVRVVCDSPGREGGRKGGGWKGEAHANTKTTTSKIAKTFLLFEKHASIHSRKKTPAACWEPTTSHYIQLESTDSLQASRQLRIHPVIQPLELLGLLPIPFQTMEEPTLVATLDRRSINWDRLGSGRL